MSRTAERSSWRKSLERLSGNDLRVLRDGIRVLARARVRRHPDALAEQPFDSHLLRSSPLFAHSRKRFVRQGGRFHPTFVSSPRTLSSPILLEQEIEYTPIERELIWAATDPIESASPKALGRLLATRKYCSCLFHEQSHRILWKFLPPPPQASKAITRYLNFVESLVIALDMALGDELGEGISRVFYLSGLTYDPGTALRRECRSRRVYRNYLHACLYATYLKLGFFEKTDIRKAIHFLFQTDRKLTERALDRALRLDSEFVRLTNPTWQKKHAPALIRRMGVHASRALVLPEEPLQNHLHYLWAERWFDLMGV